MQLPIDFTQTQFPIKEKYIDEETAVLSRWMVFGSYRDGTVAICDAQGNDIFIHVPVDQAETIVRQRNQWVSVLLISLNGARTYAGWPPL